VTRRLTIIVMGAAGAGKSTIGPLVAARLGLPFLDADDYHDPESIAIMRTGTGLTGAQRLPWLRRLNHELRDRKATGCVLACSALRPEYRAILADGLDDEVFVYLAVSEKTLAARLRARMSHFVGVNLLPSQLRALQLDDDTIVVDGEQPPATVADTIVRIVTTPPASLSPSER
jgi:carbohydrate kinase (thermoresistant glucokinase family)